MQITTLVPAFKPQFLHELLVALQAQTLKPARVIISDDSPDEAFIRSLSQPAMQPLCQALNLEVVRGPRQGGWANGQHLMRLYDRSTPFFHMLLDDDVPYPSFYARHAEAHAAHGTQAVVSRRWYARENGQPVGDLPVPQAIDAYPQRLLALPPALLFPHIVPQANNWLGEFSNVTFAAGMADFFERPQLAGVPLCGLEDIGAMLVAAERAPIVLVNEHLGYFRTSAVQNSRQPLSPAFKQGVFAWIPLALVGLKLGYLDGATVQAAVSNAAAGALARYVDEADLAAVCATLPALIQGDPGAGDTFLQAWSAYLGWQP